MFDALIGFVKDILHIFRCWIVVSDGERAVLYRLGRAKCVLEPGFYLKWPFYVDVDTHTSVREELTTVNSQDLTTKDRLQFHGSMAFRYQVLPDKVLIFQTTLGDEISAVLSAFGGAVSEAVENHTLLEINDPAETSSFRQAVLQIARKRLNAYGFKVYDCWWVQKTTPRTMRVITGA